MPKIVNLEHVPFRWARLEHVQNLWTLRRKRNAFDSDAVDITNIE